MPSVWQPYLPDYILQDLAAHPEAGLAGRWRRFTAAVLFADISGFTAMSEALAAAGKGGAEELTGVLNRYFEEMIALAREYGGMTGKFGGDSITVLFPCAPRQCSATARRAAQCAFAMQRRMAAYAAISTSAGEFSLTMKAGLAAGQVLSLIAGVPRERLETAAAGAALEWAAQAEHIARPGEAAAHPSLLALGGGLPTAGKREGCFILSPPRRARRAPLPLPPDLPDALAQEAAAFLPPSIASRLAQGRASFVNEHRKVSVVFVSFTGFDYDHDPAAPLRLQEYLRHAIRLVGRYDGALNKADMGDKGSKLLLTFGAPIAHEDDEERALRCALELRAPGVRIGVSSAFVYCGLVGSERRREYTVIGDGVNLAARLMQAAAPGQILASQAAQRAAEGRFQWGQPLTLALKGKAEAATAYPLEGLPEEAALRLSEPPPGLPLVGRRRELRLFSGLLERTLRGEGQALGVTAEAGMGKSRLAAEMIGLAQQRGLACYGGECLSHGANSAYLLWQPVFRVLFGLQAGQPPARQVERLAAALEALDATFLPRMPLLAPLVNLPLPDNELTRPLEARTRKEMLEELAAACLRRAALQHPFLLVLEDCHWIDPLSRDLLLAALRLLAGAPAAALVIYRPAEDDRNALGIQRLAHFSEIRLEELSREEAGELISIKLAHLFGAGEFPAELSERIFARAQGNPFYMDEMVNLLHDRGIDPHDRRAIQSLELPDSLHSLVLSRIDQLDEAAKTTLKVASVIGRSFKASWLWGAYPALGAPAQVQAQLTHLSRLEITPLDRAEPEAEYIFKHIVTREVAYESLAVATRAMLHGAVGGYIERGGDAAQSLDLLAYHYGLSRDLPKQREYFAKAGQAAEAAYANQAAASYYSRLLPLLPRGEQAEIALRLGRACQFIGEWQRAQAAYRQAAENAPGPRLLARAHLARGALLRWQGDLDEARRWMEIARAALEQDGDLDGLKDALRELGVAAWNEGEYEQALVHLQRSSQLAFQLDDRKSLFQALGNMGIVYQVQGDLTRALSLYQECRGVAAELGDRMSANIALGNIGTVYQEMGDYPAAWQAYSENLRNAYELGYRLGVGIALDNLGGVYFALGDAAAAQTCHTYALGLAQELGDRTGVSRALAALGRLFLQQGRLDQADPALRRAVEICRELEAAYELCEALSLLADLEEQRGELDAARAFNQEALEWAGEAEREDVAFTARLRQARLDAVPAQLEALRAQAEPGSPERAAAAYELWRLEPSQEALRAEAETAYRSLYARTPEAEYRRRLLSLGGEAPPPFPALPPPPGLNLSSSRISGEKVFIISPHGNRARS
jgi:class 3 adenylate cyclase/tetratricopeptide (TPR) repeat protein